MSNQRGKNRPRVMFVCDQSLADTLQEWAEGENRSRSNLIETLLEEVVSQRQSTQLSGDDLIDQVKKFIALLLGDQERNGVSYVLLGQSLGLDPEKLHELYLMVQQCRKTQQ